MARDVDPRFDPAFQRGYDRAPVEPPAVVDRPAGVEPVETRPRPVVEPVETRPRLDPVVPRRNPWLLALWIVAALFTVAGIAAQYAAQSITRGEIRNSAIDYYVLPATIEALSPWFTLAGLLAGVAALVISAVRWRPEAQ